MKNRIKSIKLPGRRALDGIFKSIRRLELRMQIVIAAILALILAAGIYSWATQHNSSRTRYEMHTTAPAAATFDNNSFAEMSADALPQPNNNRKLSTPDSLVIYYELTGGEYAPVFRMNLTDEQIAAGAKITPFIRGKWQMRGPNTLTFTPEQPWPANQKFSVKLDRDIFNPDVRPESMGATFKTSDISATIDSFALYPAANKSVIGVAIISFNYDIDTKKFADRVNLRLDGRRIDCDIKFDRFHRTAFITSAPIAIENEPQILRLKLNRIPAQTGDGLTPKLTASATIDAADNIFKISSLSTTVADDAKGLPQQLILLDTTTAAATNTDFTKCISAYLLPRDKNAEDTDAPHKWQSDEITPDVLKQSKKLNLKPMNFATPNGVYQYAFSYDVSETEDRFIYVTVAPKMISASGFAMQNGTERVMAVPYPARSVTIAGSGAILSMGGDRKLGISARGGATAAYVNLYKVKATEINHLISQTYNIFSSVDFKSWAFGAYDMSVVFKKTVPFANTSMKAVNYASVDLGDYLNRTHTDKTGIFIVQVAPTADAADYSDMRLILLTDLGIIRKVNLDETSTIFVSSLSTGGAAPDTEIYVLGRNGNSVWAGRTDESGRADIPALPWREYKNEKQPVAIIARRGDDVSFIPYDAYDRQVEYSKFDIDGEYASNVPMNAYLFSDRGIYRPGEGVVIGAVIKNRSFKPTDGIPVRIEIRDARGRVALEKSLSLTSDGMFDIKYAIPENAPLGEYYVKAFSLGAKNKDKDFLGMTSFRVEEFVPDTMKIDATIKGDDKNGWMTPENINANVTLRNLFGTPATDRRISAHATLTPTVFKFKDLSDYTFSSDFMSGTGLSQRTATQPITLELNDVTTDANGDATLNINFENAAELTGTYNLTLTVRGFEGGSGRSVQTAATTRISNAKYLVGYHANSDLSYINRNAARAVSLVAVDHTGARTTASELTLRLIKRENLTSLIKDYNDTYKYQTITRDQVILTQQLTIPAAGTSINLDTTSGGTYFIQITDSANKILANIEYFVAGDENTALNTDTNAELKIKLNASEYAPGNDIAVSITAPYSGTGLITIERDRVYAHQWFRANKTTSVQHIKLPAGFEGTGYINVSFVRDINSHDIFTTPYAYAVAPFTADAARRTIGVKLSAPTTIRDGKLNIEYKTNQNARIMIFATNSGILQVAKYKLPNPIAHFFQKAALQVNTYQILSLLLPEYKVLSEFAKTGGGDYDAADGGIAGLTNPFARRLQAPVAFYSEILSTTANKPGTITFDVPNEFNGELRIYAVAANNTGAGAASATTRVQSPLVITPSTPLFVAPRDTFEIGTTITNMTDNDAADKIDASVKTSGPVEITDQDSTTFIIPTGTEKLWTLAARATDAIGAAEVIINTVIPSVATKQVAATLSVRPTSTLATLIETGILDSKSASVKLKNIAMYPESNIRQLFISQSPDALIRPLVEYLKKYPFSCTEQTVSRAMPYALIKASDILGISADTAKTHVLDAINILKNRQNADGSFAMWQAENTSRDNAADAHTAYITAWAAQFLTIARANGFDVPRDMLARAVDYLRTYAGTGIKNNRDAATHAFAIYVITANEYVTTSYIDIFEEFASKNIKDWESKLMGAYIAASYKLMHQDARAGELIGKYTPAANAKFAYEDDFDNNVANDGIYQYLMRQHFNAGAHAPTAAATAYINSGEYSSYTTAAVIMGLSGNTTQSSAQSITIDIDGAPTVGTVGGNGFTISLAPGAKKISLNCDSCDKAANNLFWTVIEQGYPLKSESAENGLEIIREYYNTNGQRITSGKIGETVTVKIFARTRGAVKTVTNVAIVDLMPGGFIADTDSITGSYDFAEAREDRIIIYTTVNRDDAEYSYTAQLGAAGTFTIPAIHAESMYNPSVNATGNTGTFTVTNASAK